MRGSLLFGLALLALTGCAQRQPSGAERGERAEKQLADLTHDRVAGKPVNCIDSLRPGGPVVVAPDKLVFNDVGTVWISDVPDCPFLRNDDVIVISELYGSQLCRNDRFRTVQRGLSIPSGVCRYGSFTPWRRK